MNKDEQPDHGVYLDADESVAILDVMIKAGIMMPKGFYLNAICADMPDGTTASHIVLAFDMPTEHGIHLHSYVLSPDAAEAMMLQLPHVLQQQKADTETLQRRAN